MPYLLLPFVRIIAAFFTNVESFFNNFAVIIYTLSLLRKVLEFGSVKIYFNFGYHSIHFQFAVSQNFVLFQVHPQNDRTSGSPFKDALGECRPSFDDDSSYLTISARTWDWDQASYAAAVAKSVYIKITKCFGRINNNPHECC